MSGPAGEMDESAVVTGIAIDAHSTIDCDLHCNDDRLAKRIVAGQAISPHPIGVPRTQRPYSGATSVSPTFPARFHQRARLKNSRLDMSSKAALVRSGAGQLPRRMGGAAKQCKPCEPVSRWLVADAHLKGDSVLVAYGDVHLHSCPPYSPGIESHYPTVRRYRRQLNPRPLTNQRWHA